MSIVERLTEGIVNRDLSAEGAALISKWEQTGLLEGIGDDNQRNGMARLLENQAKELLRESSSMAAGDVEGFSAVAFPLVRRVFGSLIANDLVSVQPMSLPSGLIFFLDFTFGGTFSAPEETRLGFVKGNSLYGGGVVGAQLTGGVDLGGSSGTDAGGPYNLRNGYSSPTGSLGTAITRLDIVASGAVRGDGAVDGDVEPNGLGSATIDELNEILRFDPDIVSGTGFAIYNITVTDADKFNRDDLVAIDFVGLSGAKLLRRLTRLSRSAGGDTINENVIQFVVVGISGSGNERAFGVSSSVSAITAISVPLEDDFVGGNGLGSLRGDPTWGLENNEDIPEIDIKVDSVAVTAITKKLKAKWTPELGQDLNAYHNLDAEVELTQILSEQIALEIDREILEDLVKGATAGVRYWSRRPGDFLNRETGAASLVTQDFTGNVSEWYETLVETINEVSAQIHRKTLRGAANFVVCGPEIANILEFTAGFRANVTADADRGDIGAVKVGALSRKFDVMVDPYFPRNLLLVGRRGASFLESGYVYAPYVPLQTTPTIFGVEDFVPRKGVMTRYAKKMVRPDMYGLVVCKGLEE